MHIADSYRLSWDTGQPHRPALCSLAFRKGATQRVRGTPSFFITPTFTQMLEMEVVETKTDSHDWDVLLGRDVLSRAMFTMDFGGRFAIALLS